MAFATPQHNIDSSISNIRLQLYILGLFRLTEAIAWTSIFAYVPFMVASFPSVLEKDVAFYSGALVAVFTFSEFLSGMFWARVSDCIGRRPTLLFSLVGGIIPALIFGFSKWLPMAIAARVIGGLTNPNVGVVPTCVGELATKKEQQAKAFSIVPFMRGMGNLVGPVLGGVLADPTVQYPSVFVENSIFRKFPYLLPNLAVGSFSGVSLIVGILFLAESNPNLAQRQDIGLYAGGKIRSLFDRTGEEQDRGTYVAVDTEEVDVFQGPSETRPVRRSVDEEHELELKPPSERCSENRVVEITNDNNGELFKGAFNSQVLLQVLSVSLLAFHKVSSDVIMPKFLAFPARTDDSSLQPESLLQSKGLGLDAVEIGAILLCQAIGAILSQYLIIPRVVQRIGALSAYRIVLWILPSLYLLTPFIAGLNSPLSSMVVSVDLIVKVICSSMGYTCSAILITNTAPSKKSLARVNGAAASLGCLARAVGPIISGQLFGIGVQKGMIGICFWTLSGVALIGALESIFLKDHA